MNKILTEINDIIIANNCGCFELNTKELTIKHKLSMNEARSNVCNHKVFTLITGYLIKNKINYKLTDGYHIIIEPININ